MERRRRRRWWPWVLLAGVAACAATLVALVRVLPLSSEAMRRQIVETLSSRLDADVQLADVQLQLFPRIRAAGHDLVVRKRSLSGRPPLIHIASFAVEGDIRGMLRRHVAHVTLDGLNIEIPPSDRDDSDAADAPDARQADRPLRNDGIGRGVIIDTLDSTNASLVLVPRERDKTPKTWAIHTLRMHGVGVDQAMPFDATLTNAIPPGEIQTTGSFGPWQPDDPGRTPLNGAFTFARADLSVFHGISGILSAHGRFGGTLAVIDINGETETPDFTIRAGNHPFALHTTYHSVVNGTNGNTYLKRIDGAFLHTTLVASGDVVETRNGVHGRTVALDVDMSQSRIEDILRMVMKGNQPLMVGGLALKTKFLLPPGELDVVDRLRLDGRFSMAKVRFTNIDVQGKIDELSHRSRGMRSGASAESAVSNFRGRFRLDRSRITLPSLTFDTPGTRVELAGAFGLKAETLDFTGALLMDAKISETQTGFKRLILKAVDPLFKREGGGSEVPIKIAGTVGAPKFGLDAHRLFHRGKSTKK